MFSNVSFHPPIRLKFLFEITTPLLFIFNPFPFVYVPIDMRMLFIFISILFSTAFCIVFKGSFFTRPLLLSFPLTETYIFVENITDIVFVVEFPE